MTDITFRTRRSVARAVTTALLAFVAATAAACGGDSGDGPSGDGDYRIVQIPVAFGEFNTTTNAGAKKAAERLGVDLELQIPAKPDLESQTSTVNAVIASRPDAILIEPIDGKGMIAPLKQARSAGIEVITYDSNLEDESVPTSFVAVDYVEAGRLTGLEIGKLTNGQGKVLHVALIPGLPFTQKLLNGWNEAVESEPGLENLPTQYSEGEPSKAAAIVSGTLARHPDLAGVMIGVDTPEQQAGLNAIDGRNATDAKVVAFNATPTTLKWLNEGRVDSIVSVPAFDFGVEMVETAVSALEGEDVPAFVELDSCVITKQNVDDSSVKPCIYLRAGE